VVDFWKLNLYQGYKFQFTVNSSTVNSYIGFGFPTLYSLLHDDHQAA
jgi:hypothetical protein